MRWGYGVRFTPSPAVPARQPHQRLEVGNLMRGCLEEAYLPGAIPSARRRFWCKERSGAGAAGHYRGQMNFRETTFNCF